MDLKQELYDIYQMWHVPFWQTRTFYVGVALIGLLLATGLIYLIVRKKRAKKLARTPWEQALHELQELQKRNIASVEHGKEFYHALTSLVKHYLQARFDFAACDKTDDELLICLVAADFPLPLIEQIRSIFNGSLYIKFANVRAVQEQIERDIAGFITLIQETIPTENNKKD